MRNRSNKTSRKYEGFDILKFLDKYEFEYTQRGKNIGAQWVGLSECPFCNIPGNHFGINIQSKGYHCWGCGEKGTPVTLVKELLKISIGESLKIIKEFYDGDLEFNIKESGNKVILPSNMIELNKTAKNYLISRNFDPDYLSKKYQLKCTGMNSIADLNGYKSDFRYRIIIPIYMHRVLVAYTGRDYTGIREPRYHHIFIEGCIIPPSSCIYNIDTVKNKCIILEGPTDVWRMGDECISLQGIQVTKEQIRFLAESGIKKAVIMFDAGKEDEARKLGNILMSVVPKVQVASLPEGDPGELSDSEAIKIKKEILG